ncbi:MAG: hypothetical protein UHO11_10775 [Treponema sp.]|nr:hypothetical protein [Treponema sp.]
MRNRFFGKKINFSLSERFRRTGFFCALFGSFLIFQVFGATAKTTPNHGTYASYNFDAEQGYGITLTDNLSIETVGIYSTVEINLNGYTLTIGSIEYGNSGYADVVASFTVTGTGSLYLGDVTTNSYAVSGSSFTVNGEIYVVQTGTSYSNFININLGSNIVNPTDNTFYWTGAGSDKNWTTGKNWYYNSSDNTHYPGESGYANKPVYFLGTEAANVILNETITLTSTLYINSADENPITFDLNGNTLKVDTIILNSDNTASNNSNMFISGSGLFECAKLDYPNTKEHTVTINEDCELKITSTFYGDGISDFMWFTGDGTLSIPGSGANLNWCDGNKKTTVKYTDMKNIKASCRPSYYAVSFSGADNFGSGNDITVSVTKDKNGENPGSNPLNFPYKIFLTDNSKNSIFKFDSNALTDTVDSNISKTEYSTESKIFAVNDVSGFTNLENEDGFTITFYAPDGSGLVLGSVNWKKKYPTWTGTTDTDWTKTSNWAGISELTGLDLSDLSDYEITLINGLTNYPEITPGQDITVKKLVIEGGAEFKVSGGSFTAQESIVVKGEYDFGISEVDVSSGSLTAAEIEVQNNSEFNLSGGELHTDLLFINGKNDSRKTEFKFSSGSFTGKNGSGSYADFKAEQNASTDLSVDAFEVNNFTLSDEDSGIAPVFNLNRTVLTVNGAYSNTGGSVYTKMRYSENCSVAAETADAGTWVFVAPEASDKWVYVKPVTNLSYNDVIISLSSIKQTCIGGDIKANSIEINTSGGSNDSLVVFSDCTVDSPVSYTLSQDGLTFITTYTTSSSESYHAIEFKQTVNTGIYPLKTSGEGSVKFSGAVTAGSLSADTEVTLAADITVSGAIDFSKAVTSEGPVTITADGNITFTDELLVSGMLNLISGVAGTPETVIFTSTVDSEAGGPGSITVGSEEIPSLTELNKSVGSNKALDSILLYGAVTVESGCSLIKTGGVAGKYAEFKGGFSGTPDILLTGNAKIFGDNTFNSFKVDNSAILRATEVLFEDGKTQHFYTAVDDGSVPPIFKGNGEGLLSLSSIYNSDSKWSAIFENTPTNKNFAYTRVSYSESVDSAGNANDLRILPKDAYVDEGTSGTTLSWFALVSYKWIGGASGLWSTLANWTDVSGNSVSYLPVYDDEICKIVFVSDFDFENAFTDVSPAVTEIKLDSMKIAGGKRFALADGNLTLSEIEIDADATFALYGKSGQTVSVSAITADSDSAIEYYDDGSSAVAATPVFAVGTSVGAKVFKNLSVKQTALGSSFDFDSAVSAKSIDCTSPVSFSGDVQTTENQDYADTVTLTGAVSFKAGDSSNSSSEINFAGGVSCGGNALSVETTGNAVFGNSTSPASGFSGDSVVLSLVGNAEIYGDNSFSSLKIDNSSYGSETTVKFEGGKTQTVTSEFSVLGADSKPVNLLSSSSSAWKIDVTAAVAADPTKINVSYAAVENSNSIYDSIIAENSTDKGKNTNWNFAGVEYVWKGINSSLWTDNENWEPATVPGSKAYAKIEAASNNPKLTLDIEAAKITVDSGAVLELQGYSVSLPDGSSASPTFVNSGTVKLFGLATQSVSGTKSNAPESLVEYNGTSSNAVTNAAWGSEYAKLVISSAADFSQDLNVSESLAISPYGTSSAVRLNGNVSAGSFSGAALNLTLGENCSEFNIAGAASLTGSVTSSADSIVMSAGNWSVSDLSLTGKTVSISGSFSTSEAFVCNAEAFFNGEFVQSGGTSTFRNNVSFSSYRTDDGLVIFDGQGAQSVSKSPSAASGAEISFADVQIGTASNTALELLAALDFTVSGKWESLAAFKASSGTATFTGDVEITGSSEFYGFCYKKVGGKLEFKNANKFETLEIDAEGAEVTFPAGQANCQVVSTYLKMCGKEGNFLTLKSSSGGSQWYIEFKGNGMDLNASYIYYIKISDSYAVKELVARESKNEYNNTNWIFPAMRFVLTLAKPDSNRLYLMFDRKIDLSRSDIKSTLVFLTEDGADSGLSIDSYSKYAETSEYTSILCTLNRNLTMADLTDVYIAYRSSGSSIICDKDGISPQEYYGHSITDFALDLITPLYGYDNRHTEYDAEQFKENINEGSWTIRNWDADQGTDGTLLLGTDILISVVQNISTPSEKLALYFDNKPASDSVSVELNKRTGGSYRLWIPSKTSEGTAVPSLDQLSEKTNDSFEKEVDDSGKKNINFVLKKSYFADGKMKSGDQVSFLFGLEDFEVCHEPKIKYSGSGVVFDTSEKSPLFSVRLKKAGDYSSVDLWSFRLKDVVQQRGGVTVMNNVINASSGEEAYIKVNMTETGPLSVVVMTLDGNVVQYLHHGTAVFGDHMFSWNGRTKSGKTVARGMYFIRVFGSGVDETRKVMVVKD